jgi:drug/metabolite transporter (DMT)-like permease
MLGKIKQFLGHGPMAMISAGLFFAGMSAMVKAVSLHIPIFQVTFFRASVSAVIIGVAMVLRGITVKGENQKLLVIRALSGFIAMSLNFYALSKINLGDASLLNQSSPVFVMLFSWIFLGEKFYRSLLGLTLLTFVGITLVLRPTGNVFNLGGGAGLMSAIFAAAAYVSIRRLHQTDSFWTMAFYFMATSAVLSLPPMLLTWKNPSAREWLMLICCGIFGTLGQLLMTYAYKHEEASWVAPFAYAGVLFSFVLGVIFFSEVPDLYTLVGGILTIASGIALLHLKRVIRVPYSAIIPPSPED